MKVYFRSLPSRALGLFWKEMPGYQLVACNFEALCLAYVYALTEP